MDQVKIGNFISECRKKQKLTQAELAEMFGISDRAVSKWETGKSLPDASIMLELCNVLKISVNDLLSGEIVTMNENSKKQEKMLLELVKEKQEADKRLLKVEVFLVWLTVIVLFGLLSIAIFVNMEDWLKAVLIISGFVIFLAGCFIALRIEQVAGYYECKKCGHKYIPTFKAVSTSEHIGRSRRMKCPNCNKRTWCKKILVK